jgi:hypothetical protein
MTVATILPVQRYDSPQKWDRFYRAVLAQLQADPAVTSAAAINVLPISGFGETASFGIVGRPPFAQGEVPSSASRFTPKDYLQVMGIPLIAGRWLAAEDDVARSIVVSQGTRDFFPQGAVGQQLQMATMIGVVGDVRVRSREAAPYRPISRWAAADPYGFLSLVPG